MAHRAWVSTVVVGLVFFGGGITLSPPKIIIGKPVPNTSHMIFSNCHYGVTVPHSGWNNPNRYRNRYRNRKEMAFGHEKFNV